MSDERPQTPMGWSDTDWLKHLEDQRAFSDHPLSSLHISQGSMDAAADAYEAEYKAAQAARVATLTAERDQLRARVAELERDYNELLFAVGKKWPNESRHETAVRYIQQAEQSDATAGMTQQENP